MAKIPIEIILQDAESPVTPTPTPEPGEETNITVPDTGTISDVNNSGGIGSTAGIMLSALVAILAIGAIVAIIVRRHQKRKKTNTRINTNSEKYNVKVNRKVTNEKEKLATVASSTIAIFAATVLLGNLVIPATKAATSVEPGTAELETEDKITIIATREQNSDEAIIATVQNTSYATANLDFGYKVTAAMAADATTANLYLDGDETSEYYIAPVEDGVLADNTWGYRLSEEDEDYLPVPIVDNPATVAEGEEAVEHEEINVYYTVKANDELPLGTYSGEIEYNIEGNHGFPDTLTTMQGMTHEICESVPTPNAFKADGVTIEDNVPTATLTDVRDNKTYTIAKLADGKCWMTQNLDLDLSTEITLTPEDTDVSEDWTPLRSTIDFTGTTVDGWQNDNYTPYSANPGDVYYYTSGTDADDIKYNSLEDCEEAEHTDCSHYHAGNYYNWSAAVASNDTSGITTQYENAPDSICPAGWRLPNGNNSSETGLIEREMGSVLSDYDLVRGSCGGVCYNYLVNGFRAIRTMPIWLVRAGSVYFSLNAFGASGSYWARTTYEGAYIDALGYIGSSMIGPPTYLPKNTGASVRCLAR